MGQEVGAFIFGESPFWRTI